MSMIIYIALERLACTAGWTFKYHKPCFGTHSGPILHISTADAEMEFFFYTTKLLQNYVASIIINHTALQMCSFLTNLMTCQ